MYSSHSLQRALSEIDALPIACAERIMMPTAASPVRIGRIGSSPEIHEKIAPNGNGLFVMFANEGGDHVYVTEHSVAPVLWKSDGVAVEKDAKGRAVLRCHFEKASAAIVVFGDFGNTRKVSES